MNFVFRVQGFWCIPWTPCFQLQGSPREPDEGEWISFLKLRHFLCELCVQDVGFLVFFFWLLAFNHRAHLASHPPKMIERSRNYSSPGFVLLDGAMWPTPQARGRETTGLSSCLQGGQSRTPKGQLRAQEGRHIQAVHVYWVPWSQSNAIAMPTNEVFHLFILRRAYMWATHCCYDGGPWKMTGN